MKDYRPIIGITMGDPVGIGPEIIVTALREPATIDEIKSQSYALTPGCYVSAEKIENDDVPFEEKMSELSATLYEQFAKSGKLEEVIKKNLLALGFGI